MKRPLAQGTLFARWIVVISAGLAALGCSSRPSRIEAIDVNPGRLSAQIISECDTNGNDSLSKDELQALPPIHQAFASYDADKNGEVSSDELTTRLKIVFDPNMGGLLPAGCRVTNNGRPFEGAIVRFVPPKVLEGVLPAASGTTGSDGRTGLQLAPEDMPANLPSKNIVAMRPGLYLVEVTHPSLSIPAQYNTQTTLGKEVFSQILNGPPLAIELKF